MAATLSVCTNEEQRSAVRFLWAEDVQGAEIHLLYVLSMGIMLFLGEMHTSRQKCSRKATQV
jgi:hypothetical protein